MKQFRDLTLYSPKPNQTLLMAADISASIGEKPGDDLQVPIKVTAKYAARVCLMELMAQNAVPQSIFTLVGNEKNPTGKLVWEAIEEELTQLPYETSVTLNGSTEDNMQTTQTSIGVIALGVVEGEFSEPSYEDAKLVIQVGTPYVGSDMLAHESELPTYDDLHNWVHTDSILDIIPVGSSGSQHDLAYLKTQGQLKLKETEASWLELSGGPSTSFVLVLNQETVPALIEDNFNYQVLAVTYD